jgi:hypothetical protein
VVNVPNLMLHHPDCDHISDLMTKAAKACADGPNAATELRLWAQKGKGKLVDLRNLRSVTKCTDYASGSSGWHPARVGLAL